MHSWSDKDFDWESLSEAIDFIDKWFKFARIQVMQSKEKFGEARIYCKLGVEQFHELWKPGWVYSQYPYKWMWKLDCNVGRYLIKPLNFFIYRFHKLWYRIIYALAVVQWPHIANEITNMANWPILLNGINNINQCPGCKQWGNWRGNTDTVEDKELCNNHHQGKKNKETRFRRSQYKSLKHQFENKETCQYKANKIMTNIAESYEPKSQKE